MAKMLSKWEFIEKWLEKRGLRKEAQLARKIEKTLAAIYGNTITGAWERDYDKVKNIKTLEDLRRIVSRQEYCIACMLEDWDCIKCKFAKKAGRCDDDESLFEDFFDRLLLL